MNKLVSVIIPCYNKSEWIKEAIDSCLNQTYPNIEIIVIDDGSTDNSLEIIKSYGDKVIWENGRNQGANHARNRGFALSSGEYIQYLDADDYLLPEKIAKQVCCLEKTDANLVYGNVICKYYAADEISSSEELQTCGSHDDILEFLLSFEYFLQTASPLIERQAIVNSEGWDENLQAAQDIDFFLTLAIDEVKFIYQPDCNTVYRYYDSEGKISADKTKLWSHRLLVIEKVEKTLQKHNKLTDKYQKALADACFRVALFGCVYLNSAQYFLLLRKTITLCPSFQPNSSMLKSGGKIYKVLHSFLGFMTAGIVYRRIKQLNFLRQKNRNIVCGEPKNKTNVRKLSY